jgi:polysaccharide deacetylase family protein (PEP-CTERM system associated)
MTRHILTVDVEDNFTRDELIDKSDWPLYEGQVVENTLKILHLLKNCKTEATFFVVGHLAERHPEIIQHIVAGGHEVASHSYSHEPLKSKSLDFIEADIRKSKELLQSLSGQNILGYRAMGYSCPKDLKCFHKILIAHGYTYDASQQYHNGQMRMTISNGPLIQVFPSYLRIGGSRIIFSGGTYLRLLPLRLIEAGYRQYESEKLPVVLYVHPWEFNKDQPRRHVRFLQKCLQSPCTFTTPKKIEYLLRKRPHISARRYLGFQC